MQLSETLMEQRKQIAMDEIAGAALELFSEQGFEATSVDAIAAAAGCSPRTFYRYFATKEDVMFHDLPEAMERLDQVLVRHLNEGLDPWQAACESVIELIARFDSGHQTIPLQRIRLWMSEPGLRGRYLDYMSQAESVIAERLQKQRRTRPHHDDLPRLIAACTTGAYRVTLLTHAPTGAPLAKHLRTALATIGEGLAAADQQSRAARPRSAHSRKPAPAGRRRRPTPRS